MPVYKIELSFGAELGVRMTKREAEREGRRLQDAIMNAIDEVLFGAAPEPKGELLYNMRGAKPVVTRLDD